MTADILFSTHNALAKIILNRPHALNALNREMFIALYDHLEKWQKDPTIQAVLIRSSCEKAFCAGGDIRAIYDNRDAPVETLAAYFKLEYAINKMIYHYQKPIIALTHGITMGGGVGLSLHASHCIAAENLRWAMPETLIGFFPDVGASYRLSRLPHHIGLYLALTGQSLNVQQAHELQLVHYSILQNSFDVLEKKLCEPSLNSEGVTTIVTAFSAPVGEKQSLLNVDKIAACFCFPTVEEILAALEKDESDFAKETVQQLRQRSPTSLKVALKQLQLAKNKTLDDVIVMDLHIAEVMLQHSDFFEGVRAAIVDKDKNPRWNPSDLSKTQEDVYF